ncbi:MAG: hypothetical protein K6G76_07070 [Lachnospiraceae bacterium]|nr:hypothetical protein [Lachnospiraceae bacterium]
MKRLLELLNDGNSRTLEMLADELGTTTDDVIRQMEYLECIGAIRKVVKPFEKKNPCASCSGCESGSAACKGCIPQNAAVNMGQMWEVL